MKKILIGTSLILSLSPLAHAQVDDGQFAVLKTDKPCDINAPEGMDKSQVYYSKDCSTAYILPPSKMIASVSKPSYLAGSDESVCTAFYEHNKMSTEYQKRISALNKQIDKAASTIPTSEEHKKNIEFQITEMKKQVAYYQEQTKALVSEYDNMSALRVGFTVTNGLMDSVMAFQAANLVPGANTKAVYPTRIMPVQMTDATLVVSNPESDQYSGRMVTRVNFPGYRAAPVNGFTQDPNATYVVMNGGLSGIVDIAASAYCMNRKMAKNKDDVVTQSVALNLFYNVRVQTGTKLYVNATLQTKEFLRDLQNVIVKGKYQRNDFTRDIIKGGLKNSITITLDDKGEATTNLEDIITKSTENPVALLVSQVLSKYIDRVEDKLEQLGVFTKVDAPRAKEVPNGTDNKQVGVREICHRSSGFFGIGASSSCHLEPIIVQVDSDGLSELSKAQTDDSYITEEVRYETNQTHSVPHTSAFRY